MFECCTIQLLVAGIHAVSLYFQMYSCLRMTALDLFCVLKQVMAFTCHPSLGKNVFVQNECLPQRQVAQLHHLLLGN